MYCPPLEPGAHRHAAARPPLTAAPPRMPANFTPGGRPPIFTRNGRRELLSCRPSLPSVRPRAVLAPAGTTGAYDRAVATKLTPRRRTGTPSDAFPGTDGAT